MRSFSNITLILLYILLHFDIIFKNLNKKITNNKINANRKETFFRNENWNASIKSWHVFQRIQGFETQVEKSTKELIPIFLEIGSGLSKYNQTDADVLTMQTRYTWTFCSKFPERKFLTWTNENFWEIDGRQAWVYSPNFACLWSIPEKERKIFREHWQLLRIVKNFSKNYNLI